MRFTKIFSKIILSLTLMFAFCLPCLNNVKAATSYDVIFRAGAHGSFNGESKYVVEKEYGNKWIYSNSDGYFYYDGIISSGGRAEDKFLKSIMLSGDVDFAETKKTVVYYSTMTTGEPSKIYTFSRWCRI